MWPTYFILFSLALLSTGTDAAECENGWVAYKDELCIKSFSNLLTYDEAREFCSSQGNELAPSSLVIVKEADMQNLLENITQDIYDNLWLGSQYDEEAGEFRWDDGEQLTYTNWQEGYPRNVTDSKVCIELRPANAKISTNAEGKWADVTCLKRNLVMCQRTLSWTLQDAINEIIKLRKQLQDEVEHSARERNQIMDQLQSTKQELQSVSTKVVPVGSIYIEYYNEPSPATLWPTLTWQDISNSFAGHFFRVVGGGSANWGQSQAECAPRISEVDFWYSTSIEYTDNIKLPSSGWSDLLWAGWYGSGDNFRERVQFHVEQCEVRPKNHAIRIWKRMA